jgi:hypothetical protein
LVVEDSDAGAAIAYELERGCASGVDSAAQPAAQVEQLGSRCAPGMSRLGAASGPLAIGPTQAAEVKLTLGRNACVRAGVATQPAGAPVELVLMGPTQAQEVGRVSGGGPLLLGRDGPLCVREAGAYVLRLRSLRGGAQAWVGAWALQEPAPNSSQ